MTCAVTTKRMTRRDWTEVATQFRDLSYPQCGTYADLAAQDTGSISEFVAIFRSNALLGLSNVRLKKLPFSPLGVAYVNGGPITCSTGKFSKEIFGDCIGALCREYVENRGLMLRITPPLWGGLLQNAQIACLETRGFQSSRWHKPYETFVLDLNRPTADIRKAFDPKWRADLSKAEKLNIELTTSVAASDFERFEPLFLDLAREKGFSSRQDVAFFRRVQEEAQPNEKMIINLAWHSGELIAGHIGSFAGDTATYLLGASNPKGRELRASYLLQWAVIQHAQANAKLFYDLGGIDLRANPNVYRFKKRLNGRHVVGIGMYELAPNPLSARVLHLAESAYNGLRSFGRKKG
jgi:hypothetical protein